MPPCCDSAWTPGHSIAHSLATVTFASALFHAAAGDAVGELAHGLVEQVDRFAAIGLPRLHDLLAGEDRRDLVTQPVDLLDLLVCFAISTSEQPVAGLLV